MHRCAVLADSNERVGFESGHVSHAEPERLDWLSR